MSNSSDFRAWLKQRRLERGLTQEDLGELVGYAAQTITKIEGGQRRPSAQLAHRLAEVLGLPPEQHAAWMAAARRNADGELAPSVAAAYRPPLPTAALPTYLTPFIGREREQAELRTLLARPDCRLVTLLGPGGVGKTRLAIETIRHLADFSDGIAFVSLAPVARSESIAPAIADSLGLVFVGGDDLFAQLVAHLRDRHMLLVLDNLEHLLDAAGATGNLLEQLLTHTAGISVLATSRERLRLAGEWVLELEGLLLPQAQARGRHETAPALKLFAGHAERVDRAFRLSAENEVAVAGICRMVDGLPLGIELAAAWTRLLSLDEIAQELTRSLDRVHLSPRTLPTRHHSLHAVVDHSWQLLSAVERAALRQFAVFQGGFTREAALEVAGANLMVLANLVDKSLLRRGAGGRYDLHEIIRQYAHAQLQQHPDEAAAVCHRHARFYLRFLAEREQTIKGGEQARVVGEIGSEIDNIRAAWGRVALPGPWAELAQAGETLQWFHEFRGWFREGAALFGRAVEQVRAALHAPDSSDGQQTLGCLLGNYGYLATRSGASAEAQQALAESHALLSGTSNLRGLGRTIYHQGALAYWSANYNEARRLLDQSGALTAVTDDRPLRAMTLTTASNLAHSVGHYEEAERLFRLALAEWRSLGNPRGKIWAITTCSVTLLAQGKHQEAEHLLRESLSLSYATDDGYGTMMTLRYLGLAALQQDDAEAAVYFLREALPLLQRVANREYLEVLNDLGTALWQAGAKGEARRTFQNALTLAMQAHAQREVLRAIVGIATHALDAGANAVSLRLARQVLAHEACSLQLRQHATELEQAARARLSPDDIEQIEREDSAQPLALVLATLGLLAPGG